MKKVIMERNANITNKQLFDFFSKEAKIEKDKTESRRKLMQQQLDKVTGGKGIRVLNYK
jgi:hypothetical protein